MAILAECPRCHRKQSLRNKACPCGANLDNEKKNQKVRYHVVCRVNGKQKWYSVSSFEGCNPFSLDDARDVESKFRVSKRENRIEIFDVRPDARMTFKELSDWYLALENVKSKKYYPTLSINLDSFNAEFGARIVGQIKASEIENYQAKRKKDGYSDSYIDHEVGAAKTVVSKAFFNNLVGGETVKAFKQVKKLLKRNANARNRILSNEKYKALMEHLPRHARIASSIAFHTGMRLGEVLNLTWDKVDLKGRTISLNASDTKDNEARTIPLYDGLYEILRSEAKPIRRADEENHVILYAGKPVKDIRTALRNACEKAGIPYGRNAKGGFTYHDLRHTFNTYMRKAGVHDSVIMEITGHSTMEMFQRYNTVDAEDTREALRQYGTFLQNVR